MKFSFFLFLLFFSISLAAQEKYIIFFETKDSRDLNAYQSNPEMLFHEDALRKKSKKNIPPDFYDLPVSQNNIRHIRDEGCTILEKSKWLNAALVECAPGIAEEINVSPKIKRILPIHENPRTDLSEKKLYPNKNSSPETPAGAEGEVDYGMATGQNQLLWLDHLHNRGFMGKDVTIAIFDVGFQGADTSMYFDSVNMTNRVIATRNFWEDTSTVYSMHDHGTLVFSILAANKPGTFVGTAPGANYLLAITDHIITETHMDEFYWVKAAEWADSIGVDIISSSLGYSVFDQGEGNYTFKDMDGETSIITKGADIAASKGILVVNSAGNAGWVTAPCDGDSVLCVGGVSYYRNYDGISSTGPTYDGRIKPDVAAQTLFIWGYNNEGLDYKIYGGTSSSTPMVSGLAACLAQAHPKRSNMEIIEAIKMSGHLAPNPDTLIGYGVPDARKADSLLSIMDNSALPERPESFREEWKIYPNPSGNVITIESLTQKNMRKIEIFSLYGKQIKAYNLDDYRKTIQINELENQAYYLKITDVSGFVSVRKLLKY